MQEGLRSLRVEGLGWAQVGELSGPLSGREKDGIGCEDRAQLNFPPRHLTLDTAQRSRAKANTGQRGPTEPSTIFHREGGSKRK